MVWVLVAWVAASLPATAFAAGSFRLKSTTVQEVSGGWHLFVTIELPKAPSIPHQSMKFIVVKTAEYERALVDNKSEPVTNRVPLANQNPTVEGMDVDFSDGSGKIFKGTRFDFTLSRDRGYVAGEYKVSVRTSDGLEIGSSQTLTLKGDNPVTDRRSISFSDKKREKIPGAEDQKGPPKANEEEYVPPSQDVTPAGSAAPFIPPEAYEKTPEEDIKVKPKGCGCSLPGANAPPAAGAAALAGLVLLVRRRRQRRQDASVVDREA